MRQTGLSRWLATGVLLACLAPALGGCFAVNRLGIAVLYKKARIPEERIVRDVAYRDGPDADALKHRLDLFLPEGEGWPTVVFVHGGGWRTGDKGLRVGGADVYGNIGRFFAARGVGAAVVNYRLLPDVAHAAQIDDVARAVAWVQGHVGRHGGDPAALFLMGHSAGAHLASRVALDPAALRPYGLSPRAVCGVIAVSGAAYDLADERTYVLAGGAGYFEDRFSDIDGWQHEVSTIPLVSAEAPPFLILYAGGESAALQRQSRLLDAALRAAGASSRVVVVPGQSHRRIVLTLSRDDRTAGPAMLAFLRETPCRHRASGTRR